MHFKLHTYKLGVGICRSLTLLGAACAAIHCSWEAENPVQVTQGGGKYLVGPWGGFDWSGGTGMS